MHWPQTEPGLSFFPHGGEPAGINIIPCKVADKPDAINDCRILLSTPKEKEDANF
jgi:hypothetical protein